MKKILIILSFFGLFLFPNIVLAQQSNCLNFDGIDDFVNLGTLSPTENFSTGFTYEAWVKWDAFKPGSRLLDIGNGINSDNICISNQIADHGHLKVTVYNGSTESQIVAPDILTLSVWQHVAVTIDGAGNTTIYINGNIVYTNVVFVPLDVARNSCFIGRSNWETDEYFDGEIDEVRIWNTVRTETEIRDYMHNPLNGNEANLVAYYDFNQGNAGNQNFTETTLTDSTTNNNDGTLTNFDLTGSTSNWVDGHKNAMQLIYDTNLEAGTIISLPLFGTGINVMVDWGDGNTDIYTTEGIKDHTYASEGEYTVTISGNFELFGNGNTTYSNIEKLTRVISFGELGLSSLYGAFSDATNLISVPSQLPYTVNNLSYMFKGATAFNQDISTWDVSSVNDMSAMFTGVTLSTENYSNILTAWSGLSLQNSVTFSAGNSRYTSSAAPNRQYIIDTYSWAITDGGVLANQADSLALVALYNSTDGANWTNNTNWLTGNLDTWNGVTVDVNGRVTSLDLSTNNLVGTIPTEIGNLANLQYLYLSNNQLIESVPSLETLYNLNELYLQGNQLDDISQIGYPESLSNISISNNNFTFYDLQQIDFSYANQFIYAPQKDVTLNQTSFCEEKDSEFTLDIQTLSDGQISDANNTYQWYLNNVVITGATAATYSISAFADINTGTYYCQITNTNFPDLTLKSQDITLKIIYAGNNQAICENFATLSATDVGTYTGTWNLTQFGGGEIADAYTNTTEVTNLEEGENIFEWVVNTGSSIYRDSVSIINNSVSALTGEDQIVYTNTTSLLADNPSQGLGFWTDIYTTTAIIDNQNTYSTTVTNLQEGLTKFEWQVTLGDCMAKDTVSVTYTPTATANAGQDSIICNDFITMYANNEIGTWTQISGAANIVNSTLYNTEITNIGQNQNIFRWTIENGDFDEITITNNSATAFAGNDTTIYYTEYPIPMSELQLNATPVTSPTTGTWTTTTGSGAYFDDDSDPSTWVHDLPAGLNYLSWTVSNGNCVASDVVLVFSANYIHNDGDGAWNEPNTWIPAVVPSMYDSVVIANGTIEILGYLAKFRFLRVSNGGLLIIKDSPAKATDGYLQGGHITIEQEIEKNKLSKALAQINVNTGGHITIEQEIEKSYGNNGIYVGSGGHITIEQEIEKSDTIADVSTPYLFVGTTNPNTPITDATVFVGNRGHITIEQEIEKGMSNQEPPSVVINSGGHVTIEQEIEKGNPALLVKNGGHITIEQEIEKGVPKGNEAQLSIRGGHVIIEQEIEKGEKNQGNTNLFVGTGGHVTIEQEIEKAQFVNSLLEAPKIKIKGGTIIVGSTTPTRAGSATIRGGHITIEQEIEKRTNETPNLVLGNAGNIDFYHDAGNIEPAYMNIENECTFTIYEEGNITLEVADKPLLFIQDGASVIDLSNNGVSNGQTILTKNFIMNKIDLFTSPIDILSSSEFNFGILNSWNEQIWTIVAPGNNLNLVEGYKFVPSIDSVAEYIGNLNNEELSIDLLNTIILPQSQRGWNLVGNPFPASLDLETIDLVGIENTFYVYNNVSNNFEVYQKGGICLNGADQYISPETGFFVKSALTENSPVFTVSSANTVHEISGLFKTTEPKEMTNGIVLSVSGTSSSDQTLVQFDENSTLGFDNNIDAFKLFSLNTDVPQLFTRDNDNDMLSINTLQEPIYGENTIVDMNFVSGTDGTYSINVDDLNLANNITVLLKDKSNNETTNLREVSSYDFNYTVGESNDRFELIFGSSVDINEIGNDGNINIYSFENSVYVSLTENERATVEIYNVLGVKIITQQISGVGTHKINVNNIYNNLIVSVKTNSELKTETVMITNK